MSNQEHIPTNARQHITLTGDSVAQINKLRSELEAKLGVRLSIADVVRHLLSKANQ